MPEGFQLVFQSAGGTVARTFDQACVLIGRSIVCDVVLDSANISRKHAEIVRDAEGWTVRDLHSRQGTAVNGSAVSSRRLAPGDRIILAPEAAEPTMLEFSLPANAGKATSQLYLDEEVGTTRILASIDLRELAKSLSKSERAKLVVQPSVHVPSADDPGGPTRLATLALLKSAGEILLAHETLDETLQPIVDLIAEHLPGRRAAVCIHDQSSGELAPRSFSRGMHLGLVAAKTETVPRPFAISRSILLEAVRAGKAMLVASAADDPRFLQAASIRRIGIRSAICVPLFHEGQIEGAIYVDSQRHSAALTGGELEIITVLGLMLASGIAQMALRNDVARERAIRERLAQYNSPQVVEQIMRSVPRQEDEMLADEYEVSVLFADLSRFTALAENWSAAEVVRVLNTVFERWTADVFARDGTLDKYIGDAVMAIFGAPLRQADHAVRAVSTARAMQQSLQAINRASPQQAPLAVRIGINSGRVIAGDIGSLRRRAYTVIGDAVNVASRLEASIAQPGEIVIGPATFQQVQAVYDCQPLGAVQLRGRRQEIEAYRVVGEQRPEP